MIELYFFLSKFKKDVVCAEVIFNLKIKKKNIILCKNLSNQIKKSRNAEVIFKTKIKQKIRNILQKLTNQ